MAATKGIARLASLYAMIERLRSIELRVAANAVEETAYMATIAAAVRADQIGDARTAIACGQREAWQIAETTRKRTETQIVGLAKLQTERQVALQTAKEMHRTSHIEQERMERVVEHAQLREVVAEGRRTQAESDDRFASRLAWTKTRQVDIAE